MRSKNINSDGAGNGADSDFINRILERFKELQFFDSQTIRWEQTTRGTRAHARTQFGGIGGWDWMYPTHKELDPTLSYSVGKFAYISPKNTLAVAGMTDLISNANVISCDGIWQAAQNIPAASGGKYNVPVFPYIAGATHVGGSTFLPGTTAPSGTPLIGDLDLVNTSTGEPTIFWIYWGQVKC